MAEFHPPLVADEYERRVATIIPFHEEIHGQVLDVALAVCPNPTRWLDTGCGPGHLVARARALAPDTEFTLADPAADMLTIARKRLPDLPAERFACVSSEALPSGPFDVITAVLCHHYYRDVEARRRAVRCCRSHLGPGGVLIVVENVRAATRAGHALQRRRWAAWQTRQGRTEQEAKEHLEREGSVFFPIAVEDHLQLFAAEGFTTCELFWRSFAQAGFLAVA